MTKKKEEYTQKTTQKVTEERKVHQHETIFTIPEINGNFCICVGNKIISKQNFVSLEEAIAYIDSKPWELIVNATCAIYDLSKNFK